jgi:hypothetical protein
MLSCSSTPWTSPLSVSDRARGNRSGDNMFTVTVNVNVELAREVQLCATLR